MPSAHPSALTRRVLFSGTCGAACAAALSACATYGAGSGAAPPPAPGSAAPAPPGGADSALAQTADIPVGGGTVYADQDIVITQPSEGEFRAFSATCTHQGCAVGDVSEGTINCPCHGSKFDVADGAVVDGPANDPLPERNIEVNGEQIVLA